MTSTRKTLVSFTILGALSACATVTNETRGTVTVSGVPYTTVTRQFDQNGEIVTTGNVIYANRSYGCDTQSPGSCEAVVRELRDSSDAGRTVVGLSATSFVISGMGQ